MGILNKKLSNKKEEVKTAQTEHWNETTVYSCVVSCPYCDYKQSIESWDCKVRSHHCNNCSKQFNIDWE